MFNSYVKLPEGNQVRFTSFECDACPSKSPKQTVQPYPTGAAYD